MNFMFDPQYSKYSIKELDIQLCVTYCVSVMSDKSHKSWLVLINQKYHYRRYDDTLM